MNLVADYGIAVVILALIALVWLFSIDPSGQNGRDRRFRGWPFDNDAETDQIRRRIDPDYWGN